MAKKGIAEAVHAHEKHMHPGQKLTKLKSGGGVTGEAMKKYGRNMARAMYQRGNARGK
jgi:hypothetical protein